MSHNRTKAGRRQASREKLAKRREPKGSQKPETDLERKRATVAQVARVYSTLEGRLSAFEKKTTAAVQQLYANEEELKGGITSAEFNLRTHQKVLNAICLELERFRLLFQAILPPEQRDTLDQPVVQMAEVTLPPAQEGGDPVVVRRPNWPYYHEQVEKDLRILAELEAQKIAEAKAAAEAEAREKEAVKAAEEKAALEAEAVMDDGEEGELPEEIAELGEGAKEEAQGEPLPNNEFPEDASIFGG